MAGLPKRYLKQVFKAGILKHIDLTRLGTDSGAADFFPAAAATAKSSAADRPPVFSRTKQLGWFERGGGNQPPPNGRL